MMNAELGRSVGQTYAPELEALLLVLRLRRREWSQVFEDSGDVLHARKLAQSAADALGELRDMLAAR